MDGRGQVGEERRGEERDGEERDGDGRSAGVLAGRDPIGRVALFGPARTRVGTGPFLARWCERAGLVVVGCAGRSIERSREAAASLEGWREDEGFGGRERVRAYAALPELLAGSEADVLVVATPPETHRDALRAALACGHVRAVLCEKPLVEPDGMRDVDALLDGFVHAGCLLEENCQWPFTLPVFERLFPNRPDGLPRRIAMGLAPVGRGLDMVLDSLSHVLSVVQGVLPVDASTELSDCRFATRDDAAEEQDLTFALSGPFPRTEIRLVLRRSETQPRPAWIALDGRRVDRRISMEGGGYRIGFVPGEGEEPDPAMPVAFEGTAAEGVPVECVDDPLGSLVYRFADTLSRTLDPKVVRVATERIRQRCRLYARILEAW